MSKSTRILARFFLRFCTKWHIIFPTQLAKPIFKESRGFSIWSCNIWTALETEFSVSPMNGCCSFPSKKWQKLACTQAIIFFFSKCYKVRSNKTCAPNIARAIFFLRMRVRSQMKRPTFDNCFSVRQILSSSLLNALCYLLGNQSLICQFIDRSIAYQRCNVTSIAPFLYQARLCVPSKSRNLCIKIWGKILIRLHGRR